jgi:hypothetical protein
MRRIPAILVLAVFCCLAGLPALSEMYKWVDESGELHIATSLTDVPPQYRDQVTRMDLGGAPAPSSTPEAASVSEPTPALDPPKPDLARFEVPYENEGATRRVIIPVTFNDNLTAPMALDTGAPGMLISIELAEKIGVFSRDSGTLLTETGGIGGSAPAILTIVDSVTVAGARDTFVPTTVTVGMSDKFEGLIGMNLLANYTVSIDSQKQVVVFEENPPSPDFRGGHDEAWWRRTFEEFRASRDFWTDREKSAQRQFSARSTAFVEFQAREAERLLQRLDLYASDNAVPRHWR